MKTADSIEQQPERKAARDSGSRPGSLRATTQPVRKKSRYEGYAARVAPWRWQPGQSGNPTGKRRYDLAAEIARACFENNEEALYKAFSKALLRGNAYAYKELADRAYGRLKEKVEVDVGPYRDLSDEDLQVRITELERKLGVPPQLAPVSDDSKPN